MKGTIPKVFKSFLRFVYSTGDASGQNMTTIATHKAIEYIRREYEGAIQGMFLESNLSGDRKINGVSFTRNRGKTRRRRSGHSQ